MRSLVAAAVLCVAVLPDLAGAQARRDSLARRDSAAARRDSIARRDSLARRDSIARRDSLDRAARDSLADTTGVKREIVEWAAPDSVMSELLTREGYAVTRYQGDRVTFRAGERIIYLEGDPAAVGRADAVLVGDTIEYNDSTEIVVARGDTLILRDPAYGPDDVIAAGRIQYDIVNRRGLVTNVSTAIESGQRWIVHGDLAALRSDTTSDRNVFYARDGWVTSCEEREPHYHFAAREMKVVAKRVLVARPAVLYIGDIPVFWLPFIFQDLRSGRRSGLIPPRFGVSDIVRNSPTYRRTVEDFGYYFNLGDYADAEFTLDWRSSARETDSDPGYMRYSSSWRYRWLNRFLSGQFTAARLKQTNGLRNDQLSWSHEQQFSSKSRLNMNLNYVSSTQIQRRTTFNPYAALATINSQLNFQQSVGKLQFALGGSRRQYPGRDQVDQDFPSINLSSQPLNLGEWLTWTPSFQFGNQQSLNVDQQGEFAFRLFRRSDGTLDSARVKQNQRNTRMSFETPLKIFGFDWRNSFRVTDAENDYPQSRVIVDVADSSRKTRRVFARTFQTSIDWETGFTLPSLFQSTWKLTPTVSLSNVDAGGFLLRNERTGGEFVRNSKRLTYGLSSAPTLFGLFPGFGPVSRFRHSISPTINYEFAPKATVSDEYLNAIGSTRQGYLGALARNAVSLGLSTNIEAKLRGRQDTATTPESAQKVKLLSVNFTSLSYDFERARQTGRGFVTTTFGYTVRSDLLPGFDVGVDYDLFQGDVLRSDTAEFKPFRTGIRGSLSLNRNSGIVGAIGRLFGVRPRPPDARDTSRAGALPRADTMVSRSIASQPITGSVNRAAMFSVPTGNGWQASLNFSSVRQRPVRGGTQIDVDPLAFCRDFIDNPFQYQQCLESRPVIPGGQDGFNETTPGGVVFRSPPQTTLQGSMSFNITQKWAAQWSTTYDFEEKDFGSHIVSLQRELHDWNAIFAFTQSPNGNTAFNFFIALKAQPDLKFNYDRRSFRRPPSTQSQ